MGEQIRKKASLNPATSKAGVTTIVLSLATIIQVLAGAWAEYQVSGQFDIGPAIPSFSALVAGIGLLRAKDA